MRRSRVTLLVTAAFAGVASTSIARPAAGQCAAEETAKLLASNGAGEDRFGFSVSVNSDVAVVGARNDDDNGTDSGAAYVFRFDGSAWIEEAQLLASDGAPGDLFGISISVCSDVAVVGARDDDENGVLSGSAYVYRFNGSTWIEEAKLLASDGAAGDAFGWSVCVSGDLVVAGASGDDVNGGLSGSAYIYRFNGSTWTEEAKLVASDGAVADKFGESVSATANVAIVGAWGHDDNGGSSGSAYVYRFNGATWIEEAKLLASDGAAGDEFGASVAISGNVAVAGAWGNDDNGELSGSAYVYRFNGSTWVEEAKLLPSDGAAGDYFGRSLSVSGDLAIVGAYGDDDNGLDSGSVYVFRFDGGSWIEEAELLASDGAAIDLFGFGVSISGDVAIAGAFLHDDNGSNSGSGYIFGFPGCQGLVEFDPPSEFDSLGIGDFEATGPLDPGNNATTDLAIIIPDDSPLENGDVEVFFNDGINPDESWRGFNGTTFTLEVGREPSGIDVGSIDSTNDTFPDLAVSNAGDGTVSILISNGDGTFASDPTPLGVGTRPGSVIMLDFDDDTLTDLAVSDETDNNVRFYTGDGLGGFVLAETIGAGGMFTGRVRSKDVDNDKDIDVIGVNGQISASPGGPTVGSVFVMINDGGSFTLDATYDIGVNPQDLATADIDGDGFADIVAVNTDDDTVSVLLNDGDGTYTVQPATLPVGDMPLAIDAVDLDEDLDPDLAIVATDLDLGPAIQVLQNFSLPGTPAFAPPIAFEVEDEPDFDAHPRYVIDADLNEDGRSDLTTVNENVGGGAPGSVSVLLASGAINLLPAYMSVDGILAAGALDSLYGSDDNHVVIAGGGMAPAFAQRRVSARTMLPMIRLELLTYTSLDAPEALTVTVESGVIARESLLLRVLMRSFRWEQVHAQTATLDDSIVVITPTGDLRRFVDAESNTMRLRIEWLDPGLALPAEIWMARTDQAIWTVTP